MTEGITSSFHYTAPEWQAIKRAFARIGRDADRIGRGGPRLRDLIEIAAHMYLERSCDHSDLNRLKARSRARIESLKALRDKTGILRDDIAASSGSGIINSTIMLAATDAYIRQLSVWINHLENPISIREPIAPGSNAAKVSRQYFWRELIEIWCEFGGKQTGDGAVAFLYAATVPVIAALPGGNDGRALKKPAIERWLERRPDKNRQ